MSELMKSAAAIELGRLGGLKGGPARARSLSPQRRSEIAQKAALARVAKAKLNKSSDPVKKMDYIEAVKSALVSLKADRKRLISELAIIDTQIEAGKFLLRKRAIK